MKTYIYGKLKDANDIVEFLDRALPSSLDTPMFSVKLVKGSAEITLTDEAMRLLVTQDHGCTAGPEDGCSYCYYLDELDLPTSGYYELKDTDDGQYRDEGNADDLGIGGDHDDDR